jgi:hypothetical protein
LTKKTPGGEPEPKPEEIKPEYEELQLDAGQARAVVGLLAERQKIVQEANEEVGRINVALESVATAFLAKASMAGAEFVGFASGPNRTVVLRYKPKAEEEKS